MRAALVALWSKPYSCTKEREQREGIRMDQTVVMLRDIEPGQRARVKKLAGEQRLKRRLMDMGITPGIEVGVVKVAPLGDPVELTVRGYELSIRKDEAAHIEVEKL
jgi:ferrous iron transport protein A